MVERKLDGSYLLTLYREWIKSIREKNVFLKNISKNYIKIKKKFIQFFQDRVLAKKRPLRNAARPNKKKFLKNTRKGDIKKGSTQGTKQKWTWMEYSLRPCQDPIGQGHGEWNGNREMLYRSAKGEPKIKKRVEISNIR